MSRPLHGNDTSIKPPPHPLLIAPGIEFGANRFIFIMSVCDSVAKKNPSVAKKKTLGDKLERYGYFTNMTAG